MNARAVSLPAIAADLVSLTKPRLSSLVLATTAGGMWLAPGKLSPARALLCLLCTAGTVGAANALNCFLERDSDRFMARTSNRPLPAGRMEPSVALWFGICLGALSVPGLAVVANPLTALLGLAALASYVGLYTPLKPRSDAAMLVGGVPGALPPLMGWTAVTGRIELPGLALFALLFLWQMPHFLAIALFRKPEYQRAGLLSVPLVRGDEIARSQIVGYLVMLLPVSLLPYPLGIAGPFYLGVAVVFSTAFLGLGFVGYLRRLGPGWARRLFQFSLVYLAALVAAFILDAVARR